MQRTFRRTPQSRTSDFAPLSFGNSFHLIKTYLRIDLRVLEIAHAVRRIKIGFNVEIRKAGTQVPRRQQHPSCSQDNGAIGESTKRCQLSAKVMLWSSRLQMMATFNRPRCCGSEQNDQKFTSEMERTSV